MKQSHAVAYLRQLCCSGLSKEVVIREFLRAVKTVIPSDNNVFSGCDEQLSPTYHIAGFDIADMDEFIPVVISDFATKERQRRIAEWFKQHPAITDYVVWDEAFHMSDLYNLVWRRFDQHHVFWAPVRQNGKPVALLNLYRPRQHKPFDSREQALALRLLPYLAHALRVPDDKDIHYSVSGTSGMMVLNAQGAILYLSDEAKRLLALASHPIMTLDMRLQKEALLV